MIQHKTTVEKKKRIDKMEQATEIEDIYTQKYWLQKRF
jgi:hypothetical protein